MDTALRKELEERTKEYETAMSENNDPVAIQRISKEYSSFVLEITAKLMGSGADADDIREMLRVTSSSLTPGNACSLRR